MLLLRVIIAAAFVLGFVLGSISHEQDMTRQCRNTGHAGWFVKITCK